MFEHKAILQKENCLIQFNNYLKNSPNLIFNFLTKFPNVFILIQVSIENETVMSYCKNPEMDNYWDNVWKYMGKNPTYPEAQNNTNLIYQTLVPQKKISSYELVCGMSLYNKVYQHPPTNHEVLLRDAARRHNFAALESLCFICGKKLSSGEWVASKDCLGLLIHSAQIHGAPVYLLCAKIYMEYARYFLNYQCDNNNNIYQYRESVLQCLNNLYAAKFLESSSASEIHNAYYGINSFSDRLKNSFSQLSIDNQSLINKAESTGQELANQWIVQDHFAKLTIH